jgi:uncharacterized protein
LEDLAVPFEFDENKSVSNKAKHGIDFSDAQALWEDPEALRVPAKNVRGEQRFALIAQYDGKIWFAVYTIRNAAVRLITVRRARKDECDRYQEIQNN